MSSNRRVREVGRNLNVKSAARRRRALSLPPVLEGLEERLVLSADVSIASSVIGGPIFQVGQTLTFDLTVTSTYPGLLTSESGVEVSDLLPIGLSNISATGSNWSILKSSSTSPSIFTAAYLGGPILPEMTFATIQVSGTLTADGVPTYSTTVGAFDTAGPDPSTTTVSVNVNPSIPASTLIVAPATGIYGGSAGLSATLTSASVPVAGEPVDFHIGSHDVGTASTNTLGVATIPAATLATINAGMITGDVTASFGGDSNFSPSSGSSDLTVTPAPLTLTADAQSKLYGAAMPTIGVTPTGLVNGDVLGSLAGTLGETTTGDLRQ